MAVQAALGPPRPGHGSVAAVGPVPVHGEGGRWAAVRARVRAPKWPLSSRASTSDSAAFLAYAGTIDFIWKPTLELGSSGSSFSQSVGFAPAPYKMPAASHLDGASAMPDQACNHTDIPCHRPSTSAAGVR